MGVHRKKIDLSLLGEEQQQRSVYQSERGEGDEIKFCVCGVCRAEACGMSVVAQPLVVVIPNFNHVHNSEKESNKFMLRYMIKTRYSDSCTFLDNVIHG
ncbi:hypothetical protein QYF61_012204 [Mycteria americana]|uniref:Uncharacterized protein n=1 Tax=Mycteria americana TaxID=33587 RepID=A0AAN7NZ51_MYCAM|nr:hypothetical protein QYF61_012204 [Mycteria americana]